MTLALVAIGLKTELPIGSSCGGNGCEEHTPVT